MVMARLRDLDVRHLEALVAVADEGTFGRAATRLGFSQAAVSQQVAALERAMGTAAFDRPGGPRPVMLTPAGRVVLEHARAVLARLDEADQALVDLLAGTAGRLLVGTFQSVSVRLLPNVVARVRTETPELDLRTFQTDDNHLLVEGVADGTLDVSFVVGGGDDPRLVVVPLRQDPFVALVPAGAEEADWPALPTSTLGGRPLVGENESSCSALVESGLRGLGVEPVYSFRSDDNGAIQAMVRAGLGPAVVPLLAVDTADPGVRVLPMDPPLTPRTIGVATARGRTVSPAAQRFVDLSVAATQELFPDG
jgi:DNA-binding transcriptional LysR family regulator